MKYIVVLNRTETDFEGTLALGEEVTQVEPAVVLCTDSKQVLAVLLDTQKAENVDWAVFEVVGGKALRRAVVFKNDGKTTYDLQIGDGTIL